MSTYFWFVSSIFFFFLLWHGLANVMKKNHNNGISFMIFQLLSFNTTTKTPMCTYVQFHLEGNWRTIMSKNNNDKSFVPQLPVYQGCSQPHSPGWARVPLSSFFHQISIHFSYFFLKLSSFWPSRWASRPPGKALTAPLPSRLQCDIQNVSKIWFSIFTTLIN